MHFCHLWSIQMSCEVIFWTDALGVKAPSERIHWSDFGIYPLSRIKCEFDVRLEQRETEQNGRGGEDQKESEGGAWTEEARSAWS